MAQKTLHENQLAVKENQASQLISRGVQTLRNDRHHRRGMPYVKMGRSVRYLMSDILTYLEKHRIDPEADHEGN